MLQDRSIAVFVLALAVLYICATLSIPVLDNVDPVGPRVYPLIVAGGFVVSALWLWAETTTESRSTAKNQQLEEEQPLRSEWPVVAGVSVCLVLYYLALVPLGFILSSSIFLFVLSSYFNRNRHLANAATSAGFSVGMYLLFTRLLEVPLPHGLLEF